MNWLKVTNPLVAALLRSPLHGLVGGSLMLIGCRGRRSGRTYTTPVNFVQDGDTLLVLSRAERTWWRNLRGGAPVTVRLRGRDFAGSGQVVEDAEGVAAGLLAIVRQSAAYRRYSGVELDSAGQPVDAARLAEFARGRVIVRVSDLRPA